MSINILHIHKFDYVIDSYKKHTMDYINILYSKYYLYTMKNLYI